MKLRDLKDGQYFRFAGGSGMVWLARGNTWYSSPAGYDGGPWYGNATVEVELYECDGCGRNDCCGCQPAAQNLSCFL